MNWRNSECALPPSPHQQGFFGGCDSSPVPFIAGLRGAQTEHAPTRWLRRKSPSPSSMQLPSAAAEGPSVQAFAISSVGEESPRSADPAGAGLPNGAEALGGSSRSETVAQLNALHGRVASDAPASAPAAQPQSPAGRKGFASLTHRNGKPEANGHGKGASGAADAQTDGPERTKSKGSSWFGVKRGRQPRPGSAEAVRSPSLKAPRQVGPVVGGIPLVAGPLPGDARSSDEISCYSEDSSVRYESVSGESTLQHHTATASHQACDKHVCSGNLGLLV